MTLHTFIIENIEQILVVWEAFARSLGAVTEGMDSEALRDHAAGILAAIAADISTDQTASEQEAKSVSSEAEGANRQSAASIHGSERHQNEFTMIQLSGEYRALRATVLRMWLPFVKEMTDAHVEEMIRFNEAIDQALAESIITFSARTKDTSDLFLAILGHDLRGPLTAMSISGDVLLHPELTDAKKRDTASHIKRSALLMNRMVRDLIEYARAQSGRGGMPVRREPLHIGTACVWAVEDAQCAYPDFTFEYVGVGDLQGHFDQIRIHQLMTNLLFNAAEYGDREYPVTVRAKGDAGEVFISVTNHGHVIPESSWRAIFKPMVRLPNSPHSVRSTTSSGLGLYIAQEIAVAHGGEISVTSAEVEGTTFTVRLPNGDV